MFNLLLSGYASADRIKDISTIEGIRSMPVIGYGLIVGLSGTGDSNINHTEESMRKMLTTMGVKTNIGDKIKTKNVASVMVSGNIPSFSRIGNRFDLSVTSIGNAKSIKDGTLLLTSLKGADGKIYGLGRGSVLVSGLSFNEEDNSYLSKNRSTSGVVNGGGSVERKWGNLDIESNKIIFLLKKPDFTTARNMAKIINSNFGEGIALIENSTGVSVKAPKNKNDLSVFISMIENLDITPAIGVAKVVVNSHTGTVVISSTVRIRNAVVSHGSLVVEIKDNVDGKGLEEGAAVEEKTTNGRAFQFSSGITLNTLVTNINRLGIGPSDLVAILQSLKEVGAMQADLIIL